MVTPRILLVEDDNNLGFVIEDNLTEKNFEVKRATNGESAYEVLLANDFDLCVLDVMLPKVDGFTLAKRIRQHKPSLPIFFLTAKNSQADKLKGLKLGAEDYITKPFDMEELVLRINNLLHTIDRVKHPDTSHVFKLGKLTFDSNEKFLQTPSGKVSLTKKQAELLKLFCIEKGNVVTRDQALRVVWGKNDYFLGRSMDVFIAKLRKFLSEDPNVQLETIHGTGFKLTAK